MKIPMIMVGALCALPCAAELVKVPYIDYSDGGKCLGEKTAECEVVTAGTQVLNHGHWYAVTGNVEMGSGRIKVRRTRNMEVNNPARLILCDGASLTFKNNRSSFPAIDFSTEGLSDWAAYAKLVIYGQRENTGKLTATNINSTAIGTPTASVAHGMFFLVINGGTVTATSKARECAGIGAGRDNLIANVTINGGIVAAKGGPGAAGIGGAGECLDSVVTINGGKVIAQGGAPGGAGIGDSGEGAFGKVTINGGTVIARGGQPWSISIGGGRGDYQTDVVINGGDVTAHRFQKQPKSFGGATVHNVLIHDDLLTGLNLEGLNGYGLNDVQPVNGMYSFFLPDGEYQLKATAADGKNGKEKSACFYVMDDDAHLVLNETDEFFLNGEDSDDGKGAGWTTTSDNRIVLTNAATYVLSGDLRGQGVDVQTSATVILSNATIRTSGEPALSVADDCSVNLKMAGLTSYLVATNEAPAIVLGDKSRLQIELAEGASQFAEIIAVSYDKKCTIEQRPKSRAHVEVKSGSFLVKSDTMAVEAGFSIPEASKDSLLMKTGPSPDNVRFADSYKHEAFVGVVPSHKITVPPHEGIESVVVSNDIEQLKHEGGGVYRAMLTEVVFIDFKAAAGYKIIGGEQACIPSLTNDVTVGSEDVPFPDLCPLWPVGDSVTAYTNAEGGLVIEGTGPMYDFASAEAVPWNPAGVTEVTIGEGVTRIGVNVLAGLLANVPVHGLTATVLDDSISLPAGAIGPAGFERIDIIDGTAHVGVSVKTNGDLTAEPKSWGKVNVQSRDVEVRDGSVIIAVPANAEKGFMVLESGESK